MTGFLLAKDYYVNRKEGVTSIIFILLVFIFFDPVRLAVASEIRVFSGIRLQFTGGYKIDDDFGYFRIELCSRATLKFA